MRELVRETCRRRLQGIGRDRLGVLQPCPFGDLEGQLRDGRALSSRPTAA